MHPLYTKVDVYNPCIYIYLCINLYIVSVNSIKLNCTLNTQVFQKFGISRNGKQEEKTKKNKIALFGI